MASVISKAGWTDKPVENFYGAIELCLVFGVVLAVGLWQLRAVRRPPS